MYLHAVRLHTVDTCTCSVTSVDCISSSTPALTVMYCINDVLPNPQDGHTPLMLAAWGGHLPVARLLVETYHCDVNVENNIVSGRS